MRSVTAGHADGASSTTRSGRLYTPESGGGAGDLHANREPRALGQTCRIGAVAVYLSAAQFLPQDRLADAMKVLFGVIVSAATLAGMSSACAQRMQGFVAHLRDLVAAAPVKHMDETGFRIAGKTRWLQILMQGSASTALLTFYRTCTKRGSLMEGVTGIVVHDHWKPYYTMLGVLHALCNAHHLRELKALVEIEKEAWARKMQTLLRAAS